MQNDQSQSCFSNDAHAYSICTHGQQTSGKKHSYCHILAPFLLQNTNTPLNKPQ